MSHWASINIWPEELIQLNRETLNHPKLMTLLANHQMAEWEIKMAEIALYCDVIVNGDYMPEQMVQLAGILHKKLIEKREQQGGLVIISSV